MPITKLFEPIRIGSLTLPNRIIMPALTTFYDIQGGDRFGDFYAERARGGAGLFILGALQALYPGRAGQSGVVPDESVQEKGIVKINHDLYIPRLRNWTEAIHGAGGLACAQIAVYGFWAKDGYGAPAEEVSPSGVRLEGDEFRPGLERLTFVRGGRPLEKDEIRAIEKEVARACVRAREANFDAVELQSLGGNLLSRFLSPRTNRRTDEYGGSLRNRSRMLLETIAEIKNELGDDFPLICRVNGDDLIEGGMAPADYAQLALLLEKAGVHAIDVMAGWYETRRPVNQMCVPRGHFVYASSAMQKAVDIPVAANIRITDPLLAEEILETDQARLIAMCSPLIADPELPLKAKEGRLDEIRTCTACCNCWSDIAQRFQPLTCSINARAGYERQRVPTPAAAPKRVWVVGGGPAGMEAARVAAERGHHVSLFEKNDHLGGQLIYADLPPHKGEWKELTRYYRSELERLGVNVHLNREIQPQDVDREQPDAVVAATGANPMLPPIEGVDRPNAATAIDILSGRKTAGGQVVVIGGGWVGLETAEFLIQRGGRVTVIEMLPELGRDVDLWNRWVLLDRLERMGLDYRLEAKAEIITPDGVMVRHEGRREFMPADTVVVAVGAESNVCLGTDLVDLDGPVVLIGDCQEPKRVKDAVETGFLAGMRV